LKFLSRFMASLDQACVGGQPGRWGGHTWD